MIRKFSWGGVFSFDKSQVLAVLPSQQSRQEGAMSLPTVGLFLIVGGKQETTQVVESLEGMWGWKWISTEVGTVLKIDLLACGVDSEKQVFCENIKSHSGGYQVRPPTVGLVS